MIISARSFDNQIPTYLERFSKVQAHKKPWGILKCESSIDNQEFLCSEDLFPVEIKKGSSEILIPFLPVTESRRVSFDRSFSYSLDCLCRTMAGQ